MKKNVLSGLAILSALLMGNSSFHCNSQENTPKITVIPRPSIIHFHKGYFEITPTTMIYYEAEDPGISAVANYLSGKLHPATGYDLAVSKMKVEKDSTNKIILKLVKNDQELLEEGYSLTVRDDYIEIAAKQPAGLFYGVQTLRQLSPVDIEAKIRVDDIRWKIPCLEIKDNPVFGWRGLMLDCSRTFLSKEYILRYIDLLALYKMNVLHLHLTDDQGWRLEIKKYPELTNICSRFSTQYPDEISGYYTQTEIREIIAHANKRFITLIPEIEMPGHSTAVFAAYPELSCNGKKTEIFPFFSGPSITKDILCAGNDDVFRFLSDVLTEVVELFPSEYIHIGGDEAPKDRWEQCPKCQARIRKESLKDEHELQSYFVQRIEQFINSKGRKLIGWDEILEGGLAENAAVMSWRGIKGGIKAARMGHNVVMSPTSHCYFDYDYQKTPLEKTYSFYPVPDELTQQQARYILGGQANMWTHIARSDSAIDRQIFPRLIALSEALWTDRNLKEFSGFQQRLADHYMRLDYLDIRYTDE